MHNTCKAEGRFVNNTHKYQIAQHQLMKREGRCACVLCVNAPSRIDRRQVKSRLNAVPTLHSATCWSTSLIPCSALAVRLLSLPLSPRFTLDTRKPRPTAVPFSAIHPISWLPSGMGMGMRIGRPVWWKVQAHCLTDTQVPERSSNRRWFVNMTRSSARTLSKHAWCDNGAIGGQAGGQHRATHDHTSTHTSALEPMPLC